MYPFSYAHVNPFSYSHGDPFSYAHVYPFSCAHVYPFTYPLGLSIRYAHLQNEFHSYGYADSRAIGHPYRFSYF